MTKRKRGKMDDELTIRATVKAAVRVRNDGPARDTMIDFPKVETVTGDGVPVLLYSAWPHGQVRVVESSMVEQVMNLYNRAARPMTILED